MKSQKKGKKKKNASKVIYALKRIFDTYHLKLSYKKIAKYFANYADQSRK